MESMEAVEIQVLADGDHGKSHCLVMPTSPSIDAKKNKLFVKTANTGLSFDDESTARTAVSTEIDEMSALHQQSLSFGSHYLSDGGTFQSHDGSFDASRIARVRSKQGDMLSIAESSGAPIEHKCLMDLDDDDDDCSDSGSKTGIKTTLGKKLLSESRDDFHGKSDRSNFATAGDFVGNSLQGENRADFYGGVSRLNFASPCNTVGNELHTESRADFYGGYSRSIFTPGSIAGNALRNTESRADFYGGSGRSNFASQGSMFADGTLDTSSRVGFYRVSCSEYEEPLSCRQKLEQPALNCDENLFTSMDGKQKQEKSSSEGGRSHSIFSAVTCCFAPTEP